VDLRGKQSICIPDLSGIHDIAENIKKNFHMTTSNIRSFFKATDAGQQPAIISQVIRPNGSVAFDSRFPAANAFSSSSCLCQPIFPFAPLQHPSRVITLITINFRMSIFGNFQVYVLTKSRTV
jgi:hypothetical protein